LPCVTQAVTRLLKSSTCMQRRAQPHLAYKIGSATRTCRRTCAFTTRSVHATRHGAPSVAHATTFPRIGCSSTPACAANDREPRTPVFAWPQRCRLALPSSHRWAQLEPGGARGLFSQHASCSKISRLLSRRVRQLLTRISFLRSAWRGCRSENWLPLVLLRSKRACRK